VEPDVLPLELVVDVPLLELEDELALEAELELALEDEDEDEVEEDEELLPALGSTQAPEAVSQTFT
jgi:hypothetical protein